tara:strand:+ start:2761 stop:2913 length:153 start_codon:yes stop_codon:yes gene_type:complete
LIEIISIELIFYILANSELSELPAAPRARVGGVRCPGVWFFLVFSPRARA